MNKYFTIMLVPEKTKAAMSLKVPGFVFRSLAFLVVLICVVIGIFIYDYSEILGQIHQNKHLAKENKQLREQIQIFQMKLNSLENDIDRINVFEQKLRIITGLTERSKAASPLKEESKGEMMDDHSQQQQAPITQPNPLESSAIKMEEQPEYIELRKSYDRQMSKSLGVQEDFIFTKTWSELIRNSFKLSKQFATFDFKYNRIKSQIAQTEAKVNELDEYLLDKQSILRSTPTILPANGWITSYYGRRVSPTSGKVKMHEGLDVGGPYGTPIVAPADGVVSFAGKKVGFGLFVQLDHGYGVETLYAHSQKLHVKRGDKVSRGDRIAQIGNTGYSTGPHLHYEIRVNGIAVDPLYYVLQ